MAKKKLRKRDIKEDQLVTVALKTSSFVQEHFTKVVAGVVVLIAAIGIILFTANARRNTATAAEREMAIAMDQFLLGEREAAATTFRGIADRYSRHQAGQTSMYFLGECNMALNRYEEAVAAYDRYLDEAGEDAVFGVAARIAKAICYEVLQEFATAADILERLSTTMDPKDARYVDVLFRAGTLYEETGDRGKALEFYRRVADLGQGPLKQRADVKVALLEP